MFITSMDVKDVVTQAQFDARFTGKPLSENAKRLLIKRGITV